ncbi:hypothetical protein CBW65_06640 [Tumebacillus avium]|uniref:DUF3800 domain-containing protein n=1 Tax=Tumebacillus avium TaxID=1903704 RepID=A0A1Y0IMQ5_9BACL|nr:DUF3800 domain-containing protein [Tumebacillus avium]ARU60805.1 hypothetical protein CBW65_06640 [Tumebacillus avium]
MYMYLDDSGGLDSDRGPLYVWAGIAIKSGGPRLTETLDSIFSEMPNTKNYNEKKGFDANYVQRKEVFDALVSFASLRIAYVVVDKQSLAEHQKSFVTGAESRAKEQGENFFLSRVVTELSKPYEDSTRKKIVLTIDGDAKRGEQSKTRLHELLSLSINFPVDRLHIWNNVEIIYDSRPNMRMLQAVDFVASFILDFYKMQFHTLGIPRRDVFLPLMSLYHTIKPKVVSRVYQLPGVDVFS